MVQCTDDIGVVSLMEEHGKELLGTQTSVSFLFVSVHQKASNHVDIMLAAGAHCGCTIKSDAPCGRLMSEERSNR